VSAMQVLNWVYVCPAKVALSEVCMCAKLVLCESMHVLS